MIPYSPSPWVDLYFYKGNPETLVMNGVFILFIVLAIITLKRRGLHGMSDRRKVAGLFLSVILSAMAGGRIWYYFARWRGLSTLVGLFDLRKGGMVSVGMLVGGFFGLLLYCSVRRDDGRDPQLELARFGDVLMPLVALSLFIYRLFACSIYGDLVGTETSLPWALRWAGVSRHPASFYLSFSALLIFAILKIFFGLDRKRGSFGRRFEGEIAFWFLLIYSFNRFWIEFFIKKAGPGLNNIQWFNIIVFFIVAHELIMYYYMIHKLKLNSLEKYAAYLKKYTWVGQHLLFWKLLVTGKVSLRGR